MGHKDLGVRKYNPSLALQQTKDGKAYLNKIRKLTPYQRLLYWIRERHKIHVARFPDGYFASQPVFQRDNSKRPATAMPHIGWDTVSPKETPAPWTDDPIFQTVFFCNVYRENDRVTTYLRDNFRSHNADEPFVMLGTILLRWYNFIPTMSRLIDSCIAASFNGDTRKEPGPANNGKPRPGWHKQQYLRLLVPLRDKGEQMFGGAYIIRPVVDGPDGEGVRKVEAIGELMTKLASDKFLLNDLLGNSKEPLYHYSGVKAGTMEYAFHRLTSFKGMGPFYCYQFIGDLAYTHVLRDAPDWFTWSFPGPGTLRGLLRLRHKSGALSAKELPRQMKQISGSEEQLLELQDQVNEDLGLQKPKTPVQQRNYKKGGEVREMQYIHMRDLTNCLCEYDKYERALYNERSIKRPYNGTGA